MSLSTPFKASSNVTTGSFIVPATVKRTLMRLTILSVARHRKNKHKPVPPSAWLSNKPQPFSKTLPCVQSGKSVMRTTASISATMPRRPKIPSRTTISARR